MIQLNSFRLSFCFILLIFLSCTGCSIVDPKKTDGLEKLMAWHEQAKTWTKDAPKACEQDYKDAETQVNEHIEKVNVIISAVSNSLLGTVDLSKATIPQDVVSSVDKFWSCCKNPPKPKPIAVDGDGNVPPACLNVTPLFSEVFVILIEWAMDQQKKSRQESAANLRKSLNSCKWDPWPNQQ